MPRISLREKTTAVTAAHDAADARTPTAVLRPILIRSLSRQRALADGEVLVQAVTPPVATRTPARGKLRRILEVAPRPAASAEAAARARQSGAGMEIDQAAGRKTTAKGWSATSTMALLSPTVDQRSIGPSQLVSGSRLDSGCGLVPVKQGNVHHAYRAAVLESSSVTSVEVEHMKPSTVNEKHDDRWSHCRCRWVENMFAKYAEALETRPLIFKCMTSALVGGVGDIVAQALSWAFRGDVSNSIFWHDTEAMRQTLAVAVDGFVVNAPFLHFAYALLDRWLPAQESPAFALAQVLVDIFILSPIYALSFIVTTGLLEGKSMEKNIVPTVRDDYATLVFWLVILGLILAPLHIYLFNRFSLKWRVLISDGIDLLWTVIACFVIEPTK